VHVPVYDHGSVDVDVLVDVDADGQFGFAPMRKIRAGSFLKKQITEGLL
jgi:hypothetical protein